MDLGEDTVKLQAECLLSLTGPFPKRIPRKMKAEAALVPVEWENRAASWVDSGKQKPFIFVEPEDLDDLLDKVSRDPTETDTARWSHDIGMQGTGLPGAFKSAVKRARDYVVGAWPRIVIDDGAGPELMPLSYDDAQEIWSVWQVVRDPVRVLDEMDSWTLSEGQVAAFKGCYPLLWARTDAAIRERIGQKKAKDPLYNLGYERAAVLRALRQLPPEDVEVPPPAAQPQKKKIEISKDDSLTQGEKSGLPK